MEFDADMIENMTQKITQLSNSLSLKEADEELLSEIKNLQEKKPCCFVRTSSTSNAPFQVCCVANLFPQSSNPSSL